MKLVLFLILCHWLVKLSKLICITKSSNSDALQAYSLGDSSSLQSPLLTSNGSLLVLMTIKIKNEEQIAKEIKWINEDYNSVCIFYSVCDWHINILADKSDIVKSFQESSSALPQSISYATTISSKLFNKFKFIRSSLDRMPKYDSVLIKDNDIRLISLSWHTFIAKSTGAVMSGSFRHSRDECKKRRQSYQFHEACNYENPTSPKWSTNLFAHMMPIEVSLVEQCFVLMDAKFALFFFNLTLRPSLLSESSDWGLDIAWCAAAKAWNGGRIGCYLVPVVPTHEDTRQIKQDKHFISNGLNAMKNYRADPLIGMWIKASRTWQKIINGKTSLEGIETKCRHLLLLDASDPFDLQACTMKNATPNDNTLDLILDMINGAIKSAVAEDSVMLYRAKRSLLDHIKQINTPLFIKLWLLSKSKSLFGCCFLLVLARASTQRRKKTFTPLGCQFWLLIVTSTQLCRLQPPMRLFLPYRRRMRRLLVPQLVHC